MISVAMTTYKSIPRFLYKQLDSLRVQTREPDEVVIVDDYSQDGTKERIETYISENGLTRWKLLSNDKNRGFKKTFKTAIAETRGDLIFLCDHDDIWMPNKIEVMNDVISDNKDILVLCSTYKIIDSEDCEDTIKQETIYNINRINKLFSKNTNLNEVVKIDYRKMIKGNYFQGCTSLMRKEIKEVFLNCFVDTVPHDYQINMHTALRNGLGAINKQLIYYRIHEKNTIGLCICNKKILDINLRVNIFKISLYEKLFLTDFVKQAAVTQSQAEFARKWACFNTARLESLENLNIFLWGKNLLKNSSIMSYDIILSYGLDLFLYNYQ
ncbi:MAG: glycosyltransferase [Synergistaceae bacterium]|nr:glycosyltransferase [Synergistaceae bacterium]